MLYEDGWAAVIKTGSRLGARAAIGCLGGAPVIS